MSESPPGQRRADPGRRWWIAVVWTIAAALSLNLAAAYVLAELLWPGQVAPRLAGGWLVALGLAGLVFLALAVISWLAYLSSRRTT